MPNGETPCYQYCLECGHVYVTEQDLMDAYNAIIREMRKTSEEPEHLQEKTSGKDIYFCQCCIHDFYS
jgi:hypothetical protein